MRNLDYQVKSNRPILLTPTALFGHVRLDENAIAAPLGNKLDVVEKSLRGSARGSGHLDLTQSRFAFDAQNPGCRIHFDCLGIGGIDNGVPGSCIRSHLRIRS